MVVTLMSLVSASSLQLKHLVRAPSELSPLEWAHSSDLMDPTPFLGADQMLLTTGSQFLNAGSESDSDYDGYVARLCAAGVRALGFGTDVVRTGTPPGLVAACERQHLPLVEVPYRVPFIAIVRFVADTLAAEAHARDAWALTAQRAVSYAALGSDGVTDSLRALARQLDRTVVLFDAAGTMTTAPGPHAIADLDVVAEEARRMIRRGTRGGSTVDSGGLVASLQSFGRRGDIGGVLAVIGTTALDSAEAMVVTAGVALTEVALGKGADLRKGMSALRTEILGLLLAGHIESARSVLDSFDEQLPGEPVVVFYTANTDNLAALALRAAADGRVHARWRGGFVVLFPAADLAEAQKWCAELHLNGGLSSPVGYAHLAEAVLAASTASEGAAVGECRLASPPGSMRALLADLGARQMATARLAPVLERPDAGELIDAATAWLRHNGQWDPAARELDIHRHSLKSRVTLVAALLDLDVDRFEARVELWALLTAETAAAGQRRTLYRCSGRPVEP